jgi:hypothetical protein
MNGRVRSTVGLLVTLYVGCLVATVRGLIHLVEDR